MQVLVSKLAESKYYRDTAEAEKAIAVLSQYKAQCSAIETELKDEGYTECSVRTVVASQGKLNHFYKWIYQMLLSASCIAPCGPGATPLVPIHFPTSLSIFYSIFYFSLFPFLTDPERGHRWFFLISFPRNTISFPRNNYLVHFEGTR